MIALKVVPICDYDIFTFLDMCQLLEVINIYAKKSFKFIRRVVYSHPIPQLQFNY